MQYLPRILILGLEKQQLRVLIIVHSTHIGQFTMAYNSSSRGFDALFWPLQAPSCVCLHINSGSTHTLKNF